MSMRILEAALKLNEIIGISQTPLKPSETYLERPDTPRNVPEMPLKLLLPFLKPYKTP